MNCSLPDEASSLAAYRGYLFVLAEGRLDDRMRGQFQIETLIEEVLIHAGQSLDDNAEQAAAETLRDLRKSLAGALVKAARASGLITGAGRSALSSIETALAASSERLERFVGETPDRPENAASRVHSLLQLADAIARLPQGERRVIEMRCLQNLPVSEISERLGKDVESVSQLIAHILSPSRA